MGVTDCVIVLLISVISSSLTLHFGFHLFSLLLLHYCAISTSQHAWLAALIYCHQIAIEQSHQTLKYSGFSRVFSSPLLHIQQHFIHTAALHNKSSTTKWGRNVLTAWRGGPRSKIFKNPSQRSFIGILSA